MTELSFKGKEFVYNHHLAVPFRPLVPHAEKGVGPVDLDGNLIVQGDNLHALKALLPRYAGKVDVVVIDPPYNTGNEGWRYSDNVTAPMIRAWLEDNPIGTDDGLRHDKWAAMVWPRLRLLHELLKDGGLIFVCCDENEGHHLRSVLDEVFGEGSHIASIAWQTRTSPDARKRLGQAHDTIHVAKKIGVDPRLNKVRRTKSQLDDFANPDDDPNGPWTSSDMTAQNPDPTKRKDQQYSITLANGEVISPPPGRCWGVLEPEFLRLRKEGRIWFGVKGDARPRIKTYLEESDGITAWTWWDKTGSGHSQEGTKELARIMSDSATFDYPKPSRLFRRIIELATQPDSIVLDSFAGSGTTAHAVLEQNARDGGNRKFILVEMEDYADELTAERVRRVMNGYGYEGTLKEELFREKVTLTKLKKADALLAKADALKAENAGRFDAVKATMKDGEFVVTGEKKVAERADGLGGGFTYCTLGEPIELDSLLTGKALPSWSALGEVLFHMATAQPWDAGAADEARGYLGQANGQHVWLIYSDDLDWLKSADAALTLSRAEGYAETTKDKPDAHHVVFAPARFVSQKLLDERGLPVEFAPLPFALYRVTRD